MAEAKVYIDGEIVSSIGEGTTFPCTLPSDVRAQLEYQKPFDSIRAIINTPGGSANAGLAMKDDLLSYGVPVHTYGVGQVASIGTAIFAAGTTRQLAKHCKFFIHLPYGGIDGTADEIIAYGEATKQLENELIDIYQGLTGQPRELLFDLCQKQTELSAQQALDYGFATSVTQEVAAKLTELPMAKAQQLIHKNNQMEEKEKSEFLGLLSGIGEKLNKLLSRKEAKALALTIVEDGRAITISGETEQAEVGQDVTLTDGGEKLPDGTYKLSNNQTITVVDGTITEAVATEEEAAKTENEEVVALKAKLADLEKENGELKNAKASAETKAEQTTEEIKALKSDFTAIKDKLQSSGAIPRDENGKRDEGKAKAENTGDAALAKIREKREERKNKNKK